MRESVLPTKMVSPVYVGILERQAIAVAIVISVLYLPLMWVAFDFKLSPFSGVLLLSPAFSICSLVRVPFLGLVVCIGFVTFAYIAVSLSLAHARIWLISTCLVLVAISTESSREIYQKTKTAAGHGLGSAAIEGTIIKRIVLGTE